MVKPLGMLLDPLPNKKDMRISKHHAMKYTQNNNYNNAALHLNSLL